jgi:UDP-3-O-[3-hydroxymyristoyl] glucosamine N-acyltransferase
MADPRFFTVSGPFTLAQLAKIAGAEIAPGADASAAFDDIAPLAAAGPRHVSFLDNRRYVDQFAASKAGACIVDPAFAERAPRGMALLLTKRPYRGYALVAQAFYPRPTVEPGVHPTAAVDAKARLGPGCRVEAGAVIAAGAEIGARCLIGANAVIGPGVALGEDSRIGACASLHFCRVGARALIHSGVRIGERGFGFAMEPDGLVEVPQVGRVLIGNDVEIGANSTVDRGTGPDTVIGDGTRIDNLVQIGHNVQLGRGCVVVAQAGIAGSTKLGDGVVIAAQAGLIGHLSIGKGARVAAQAGVMRDVPDGGTVGGSPAQPMPVYLRGAAFLARLSKKKGE